MSKIRVFCTLEIFICNEKIYLFECKEKYWYKSYISLIRRYFSSLNQFSRVGKNEEFCVEMLSRDICGRNWSYLGPSRQHFCFFRNVDFCGRFCLSIYEAFAANLVKVFCFVLSETFLRLGYGLIILLCVIFSNVQISSHIQQCAYFNPYTLLQFE